MSSFNQGLRIQLRVLHALMLREMLTRYGRHNIGFLWLFLEPMMFTLAVVALWTATGMHKSGGISIVAFGITGYSTIMLWRNMPNRAIGAIEPNASLLTHRPVQMFDVFAARIVLERGRRIRSEKCPSLPRTSPCSERCRRRRRGQRFARAV